MADRLIWYGGTNTEQQINIAVEKKLATKQDKMAPGENITFSTNLAGETVINATGGGGSGMKAITIEELDNILI